MRRIGTRAALSGFAGFALVAFGLPAAASVKDGVDAWTRGDYKAAVKQWQGPAAAGDADAQFNLAQAYRQGRGVKQDMNKAMDLFRRSAQQGHMRAADTYGLLLFVSGRREEAMPWIEASAARGEPNAQYLLGTAYFNGDLVQKDPVRAYALMSRAAATGLPRAQKSLALMDEALPLAQRQEGIALAGKLDAQAQQVRDSQLAAADLGAPAVRGPAAGPATAPQAATAPVRTTPLPRRIVGASVPPSSAAGHFQQPAEEGLTSDAGANAPRPVTAGADYANPVVISSRDHRAGAPVRVHSGALPPSASAPAPAAPPPAARPVARPAPERSGDGPWRVQLGAFGQPGNADALWAKVRGRAELSGKTRFKIAAGGVTRLQAGGFANQAEADHACAALKAGGFACLPIRP